jgi:ATP-binding cassette subfamily B protein
MSTDESSSSKPVQPKGFRRWFIGQILANPFLIIIVIGCTILAIIARTTIPVIIGTALDVAIIDLNGLLTDDQQLDLLFNFIVLILILGISQVILNVVGVFFQQKLSWGTQRRIREEFFANIQDKPLKYHDATPTGELMALATNDLGQLGGFMFGFSMITDVIISLLITATLLLTVLNSLELVIISIPFLIAYIWAALSYNKKMGPIQRTFMRKWSGIAEAIQDNIMGAEVVRAFGEEEYEKKKFMKYVIDFRDTWEKQQIIQARYFPTLVLFSAMGFSFFVGVLLILFSNFTIGGLIAYNGMLATLLVPTYIISFAISIFNGGLAGAQRIHTAMFSQAGENGLQVGALEFSTNSTGDIKFENVTFQYPQTKKPVLENINLHIAPFQSVAIVGPTGSGKSSLVKLLLRLYNYEGTIKIDNIDITEYSLESLRKGIGFIEQDIYLFPRSLKENIAIGKRDATQGEIEQAARLAQIHDFIIEQPKKYETNAGEGGSQLSGGQKQRIAIARTFITNPRILVLDDSTSSVDSRTEEEIINAIQQVTQHRTTFIITHRLSLIRNADVVIVLKDGKIVARGHHSKIIQTSPDYRRIFGKHADLPPLIVEKKSKVQPVHTVGGS